MEKEFVPYAEALALKELGFDEPCLGKFYFNQLEIGGNWCNKDFKEDPDVFISAPLYQQAFRWLREEYDLWNMIYPRGGWNYAIQGIDETKSCAGKSFHKAEMKSYEEAELECLKKLIEIIKKK
jgi:hypothetical protein